MIYSLADLDKAVRTVWGEARGEGARGWIAVAWVIRNRAEWSPPAWWGHTVSDVCLKPWQFSCWLASDPNATKIKALSDTDPTYLAIKAAVVAVFDDKTPDPTGGATNYEVVGTNAKWATGRTPSATIGHQSFYVLPPNG